ncbi:MAG: hypothetical protein KatS3mg121_1463 [Gammaproteobacteria bacterium]|nr:MAG: hypothetical protein KatS3mg121_1463 [Gammaproteobacteria bacterium]
MSTLAAQLDELLACYQALHGALEAEDWPACLEAIRRCRGLYEAIFRHPAEALLEERERLETAIGHDAAIMQQMLALRERLGAELDRFRRQKRAAQDYREAAANG